MIANLAHKTIAYTLVLILFAHNINTLVILGDFVMNQAVIAKNFCVQKDNQQGCNGHCHLSKELKQISPESNTDMPVQETLRMSLDAFCLFPDEELQFVNISVPVKKENSFLKTQILLHLYSDVETPPPNFS